MHHVVRITLFNALLREVDWLRGSRPGEGESGTGCHLNTLALVLAFQTRLALLLTQICHIIRFYAVKAASMSYGDDEAAPDPLTAAQATFHQARRGTRPSRTKIRTRQLNAPLRTAHRWAGLVQVQIEGAAVRHL